MKRIAFINCTQIVTCSGFTAKKGREMSNIGLIENGFILVHDELIHQVGSMDNIDLSSVDEYEKIDCSGKTVMPGFVDSHTHFVFGGYRADEYNWRLSGDSYMSIMEKGGGIINSVRGTKETSFDDLLKVSKKRLDSMVTFGVTTVEGKSGYGLEKEVEFKQLEVMKKLNETHSLDIVTTFMGAHTVPTEYKGRGHEFIDLIIKDMLDYVRENDLAEFCDIFCEKNVFSVEESRTLFKAAKEKGFKLKIHADEIVQLGGAELAAEVCATSADHLLQASDEGILAMRDAGVVATLLPCTAFSLKEEFARGRFMIDSGAPVALATDFNPGSCFTESIPLVIALATLQMNMTIEETITALTINGAAAVDRAKTVGSIDAGKKADIVIHEFPSYKFLPYHIAVSTVEKVFKGGRLIYDREDIKIL
ncbi:MAG: imidazolonepropionase [Acidaminobacteraceae bacterium]